MRQRVRKLIGAAILVALVPAYALLVMALAEQALALASIATRTVFFAVAGLIWILPAGALISWMLRPDPSPDA